MRLDPIVITPYDPMWPNEFARERDRVEPVLRRWLERPIEHIGSTSIPGMPAKAISDMVGVVSRMDHLEEAIDPLRRLGWVHAPEPNDAAPFPAFCTPSIEWRTHHLHVVEESEIEWRNLLAFRDFLRTHPGLASGYAALKRALASQHGSNPNQREPYRRGKADFIREVTALATATASRRSTPTSSAQETRPCTTRWAVSASSSARVATSRSVCPRRPVVREPAFRHR